MKFEDFKKIIPLINEYPLEKLDSHQKMEPEFRRNLLKNPRDYTSMTPKKAAVLMLIFPKNEEAHIVLIVRKKSPDVHSSQMAFPGGKHEDADDNYDETALRETFEEIGVHQYRVHLVRQFSEVYIPVSNFLVYPFLGIAKTEPAFSICPDEVESIVEIPLKMVLDNQYLTTVRIDTSYAQEVDVPAFKFGPYIVWGATAMMLRELKDAIEDLVL